MYPLQFVVSVAEYDAEIQAESNWLPVFHPAQALYVDKEEHHQSVKMKWEAG